MPELEFASRAPHPAVRPFIRSYTGYRQDGVTLQRHRGLPSRSITFVLSLADPIRIVDGPGGPMAAECAVGGLHLGPAIIEQDRFQYGMHLDVNPLGVQALLGVPASELANTVCDLRDLPLPWGRDLVERLREQATWEERFALLDATFAQALHPVTLLADVQWAWQELVRGRSRVAPLAEELGWSRRYFTQRFSAEVGVTPKQAARLMRFERGRDLLRSGYRGTLADLAADVGYYDQAHLTGEWRELAGCTPTEWIREELPFLQAAGAEPAADSGV